ncbi:hypothetical protein L5515_002159 [Caenorhabditis briggsae]|uniref:Uncharacterized protein n=1 Tax=Caenorhabditis briggsae TaxID=6238 RepID=A0AAE9E7Z8_CAEBR|nr:hypothetical protein L5515_002159 [Caenorhabditis briggsae]
MPADLVFKTVYCLETLQQVTVVKYPSGDFENYSFNAIQKRFFPVKCQDCIATQMDSDLTPRQAAWCPHNQQNILFAYNHVLKQVLQYHFMHETNSFCEIRCLDCKLDEDDNENRNIIMACSPSSKKPFLIRMNSEGRVQKMQWDINKETYVIIAASEINALTTRPAVVEKEVQKPLGFQNLFTSLSLEDSPLMESDLIPLHRELHEALPNAMIILAKHKDTGAYGSYVFHRFSHQFLEVVLPGIDVFKPAICPFNPLPRCIGLVMSTKTQEGINLQHTYGVPGIQKYIYRRVEKAFELMEDAPVIQKVSQLDKLLKDAIESRINEWDRRFIEKIRPFMKIQDGEEKEERCSESSGDESEIRELPSESVMKSKGDKKKSKTPEVQYLPCEFFISNQPSAPAEPKPAEQSKAPDTEKASEEEDSFEIVSAAELPKE